MQSSTKSNLVPIILLGVLFFVFGFVTWLNGTLIPYLKIACELTTFQALLVTFAFYISYFVTALPSSWILNKTGFKKGIMLGLLVISHGGIGVHSCCTDQPRHVPYRAFHHRNRACPFCKRL